jgi:ribosomal protein S18 acetylase RimI-like enzyme
MSGYLAYLSEDDDQEGEFTVVVHCSPVSGADAEKLIPLLHDAEEDDERIRAALRDPACQAYVARVDEQSVGAAVVRWDDPEPGEILYIAVAEAERGKGYGRQIIAAIQAELPARGRTLLVGTANSALDNIAFYQKCGFRMYAVKNNYFSYIQPPMRENGIVMRDMIVFRYDLDAR